MDHLGAARLGSPPAPARREPRGVPDIGGSNVAYDLVIRNGTVVDGSGERPTGPTWGCATGASRRSAGSASGVAEEIDAEGHVVTPGFIDGHTHMDAQVLWDPLGTCSCWHGVTSVVMGNCGFTLAPARADAARTSSCATSSGPRTSRPRPWPPASTGPGRPSPSTSTRSTALPKGINYAAHIGHSALRTWAMGERAFDRRRAPRTTSRDGARAARRPAGRRHRLHHLAAPPTTRPPTTARSPPGSPPGTRCAALVGVMGDLGAGMFEIAQEPAASGPRRRGARPSSSAACSDLAVETGVPITFGVLSATKRRRATGELSSTSSTAPRPRAAACSARPTAGSSTVLLSFKTRLPFDVLPEWKEVRSLPLDEQARALRDPALRAKLLDAAHARRLRRGPSAPRPASPTTTGCAILDRPMPPNPTVAEVAARAGRGPRRG